MADFIRNIYPLPLSFCSLIPVGVPLVLSNRTASSTPVLSCQHWQIFLQKNYQWSEKNYDTGRNRFTPRANPTTIGNRTEQLARTVGNKEHKQGNAKHILVGQ